MEHQHRPRAKSHAYLCAVRRRERGTRHPEDGGQWAVRALRFFCGGVCFLLGGHARMPLAPPFGPSPSSAVAPPKTIRRCPPPSAGAHVSVWPHRGPGSWPPSPSKWNSAHNIFPLLRSTMFSLFQDGPFLLPLTAPEPWPRSPGCRGGAADDGGEYGTRLWVHACVSARSAVCLCAC